jgi:hypothetical protein
MRWSIALYNTNRIMFRTFGGRSRCRGRPLPSTLCYVAAPTEQGREKQKGLTPPILAGVEKRTLFDFYLLWTMRRPTCRIAFLAPGYSPLKNFAPVVSMIVGVTKINRFL